MTGGSHLMWAITFGIGWFIVPCIGGIIGYVLGFWATFSSPEADPTPGKATIAAIYIVLLGAVNLGLFVGMVWSFNNFLRAQGWLQGNYRRSWLSWATASTISVILIGGATLIFLCCVGAPVLTFLVDVINRH
jgi:hypothetical protein